MAVRSAEARPGGAGAAVPGASQVRWPRARLLVFAKAPVPGACKTRLIPALGEQGAAAFAERLLRDTLTRLSAARLAPLELRCAPDCTHPVFTALAARLPIRLAAQRGGDLGERMGDAVAETLGEAEMAVLLGTDCPRLDARYLARALAALSGQDAVLGPASDGGYVLLGLRRSSRCGPPERDALFRAMPWGSERVAARTRERLRLHGLRWAELPALTDIDRPEDLGAAGLSEVVARAARDAAADGAPCERGRPGDTAATGGETNGGAL